jgi:hypothetical protein
MSQWNKGIFFILKGKIDQNIKNAVVCLRLEGQLALQFGISGILTQPIKFWTTKIPQRQFGAKAKRMYLYLHSVSEVTAQ